MSFPHLSRIQIRAPPRSVGTYVPIIPHRRGPVYLAGQGPVKDGKIQCRGKLGSEFSTQEGYEAIFAI